MIANFTIDTSDFDAKFKKIVERAVPELIDKGMGVAMLDLLNDCINEVPTVPFKEGWLRGSGSVFVNGKFVGDSSGSGKARYATESADVPKKMESHSIEGIVGFNAPYAARLHEGIGFHFSEKSSGPKYIEAKLRKNGKFYMSEIARVIMEGSK